MQADSTFEGQGRDITAPSVQKLLDGMVHTPPRVPQGLPYQKVTKKRCQTQDREQHTMGMGCPWLSSLRGKKLLQGGSHGGH